MFVETTINEFYVMNFINFVNETEISTLHVQRFDIDRNVIS